MSPKFPTLRNNVVVVVVVVVDRQWPIRAVFQTDATNTSII